MEQIRARVGAIVKDPKTATALKPYYLYGCKRTKFHDKYLPTFNLPHVTLVDTAPRGVSRINAAGVVHGGGEYPLDVPIYATVFSGWQHRPST